MDRAGGQPDDQVLGILDQLPHPFPHGAPPGQADQLVSSPDGLHPSTEGYKRMAVALEPAVRAALAKAHTLR